MACPTTRRSRSVIWTSSTALEDPARARALICWNINIAASNPQQRRLRRALQREDLFTVALDLFETDTTRLADVVLPAASFLECDDLVASYFDISLSAQVAAVPPLGDSLPNTEIFRRLAAAMGFQQPALHESDREMIDRLLANSGVGLTFEELARVGTVAIGDAPRVQFADLRFDTPTGRIELASAAAQAEGHPRVAEPWHDERPHDGRLRLLTPASNWSLNDMFANEPKLFGRRGPATVTLNPADAADRGLAEGDRVRLASETGDLDLELALSDKHPPRRGLFAQRPLARPGGHGCQRQRAQPWPPLRPRGLDQRARHRGHRHAGRLATANRTPVRTAADVAGDSGTTLDQPHHLPHHRCAADESAAIARAPNRRPASQPSSSRSKRPRGSCPATQFRPRARSSILTAQRIRLDQM